MKKPAQSPQGGHPCRISSARQVTTDKIHGGDCQASRCYADEASPGSIRLPTPTETTDPAVLAFNQTQDRNIALFAITLSGPL